MELLITNHCIVCGWWPQKHTESTQVTWLVKHCVRGWKGALSRPGLLTSLVGLFDGWLGCLVSSQWILLMWEVYSKADWPKVSFCLWSLRCSSLRLLISSKKTCLWSLRCSSLRLLISSKKTGLEQRTDPDGFNGSCCSQSRSVQLSFSESWRKTRPGFYDMVDWQHTGGWPFAVLQCSWWLYTMSFSCTVNRGLLECFRWNP